MCRTQPNADAVRHPPSAEYTVLARRYRPQQFADLVGQEPVAQALINAIASNRVAHAYLFTGARGVGKTCTARILAKALNCVKGPTATPCDECDICQAIATGEDVDVLEIDGASNRGIDEIRELRQNVQYPAQPGALQDLHHRRSPHAHRRRPSTPCSRRWKSRRRTSNSSSPPPKCRRSRSRSCRAASASTSPASASPRIVERLKRDRRRRRDAGRRRGPGTGRPPGRRLDARRPVAARSAAGLRRRKLTVDRSISLLGTANDERVAGLAGAVLDQRRASRPWTLLGQAADEGLQLGELLDQLIDYWRDLMVVNCAGRRRAQPERGRPAQGRHRRAGKIARHRHDPGGPRRPLDDKGPPARQRARANPHRDGPGAAEPAAKPGFRGPARAGTPGRALGGAAPTPHQPRPHRAPPRRLQHLRRHRRSKKKTQ